MHVFGCCVFVALAASVGAQAQTRPAEPPSFRSASSELVVLPVTVTNKKHGLVTDLSRDHFIVYDNGRRQDIALFTNQDTPVTIGLVIDNSGSMRPKLAEVEAATMAFARLSNPQDEIFTIAFNDTVRDAVPGRPLFASNFTELVAALHSLMPQGRTALYDSLLFGLDRLAGGTRPRKVLVLISDGGDNASRATINEVLTRARRSNAAIYTIGLFDDDDPDRNPGVLKSLARATGGERFLPQAPGSLLQSCERIAREIRGGYTIGYVPPDRDGAYHRVRVQIEPADPRRLTLRTRPGYFAAGSPTRP
jgi:Ca-activated chloride channel family protein